MLYVWDHWTSFGVFNDRVPLKLGRRGGGGRGQINKITLPHMNHTQLSRAFNVFRTSRGVFYKIYSYLTDQKSFVHLAVAGGVFDGVFCAVLFPTRCLG